MTFVTMYMIEVNKSRGFVNQWISPVDLFTWIIVVVVVVVYGSSGRLWGLELLGARANG